MFFLLCSEVADLFGHSIVSYRIQIALFDGSATHAVQNLPRGSGRYLKNRLSQIFKTMITYDYSKTYDYDVHVAAACRNHQYQFQIV